MTKFWRNFEENEEKNVKSTKSTKNWTQSLDAAIALVLCKLLGLSIQTSMLNLDSVAQKMAELLYNYVIT